MGEDDIEIFAAFGDDRCQTDNLRARTYYDTELEFAVLFPMDIRVIRFQLIFHYLYNYYIDIPIFLVSLPLDIKM